MKLLLVSAFCACSIFSFGQTEQNNLSGAPDKTVVPDSLSKLFQRNLRKQDYQLNLLPGGNKVTVLPQDNMPCVVPDSATAARIPNAWDVSILPFVSPVTPIPNPGRPPQSFRYRRSNSWVYPVVPHRK